MIYKLQLLSCAEDDISTSVLWYEKQMKGLGHRFIEKRKPTRWKKRVE